MTDKRPAWQNDILLESFLPAPHVELRVIGDS